MSSRPSQTPSKPWAEMTAREKDAAALPHLRNGKSFGAVAEILGAPSRNSIATVAGRLIKAGKLPSKKSSSTGSPGPLPMGDADGHRSIPSSPAERAKMECLGGHPDRADVKSGDRHGKGEQAVTNSKSPTTPSSRSKAPAGAAAPPPATVLAPRWSQMSPEEKRAAVKARVLEGQSMGAIATELDAPNRGSVGSVLDRLRVLGELPGRDNVEAGREGRLVRRMARIHPGNLRGKAEGRHLDPGLPVTITAAAAWDPIPGVDPVALVDIPAFGRCRWPVEHSAPGHFMCGAPTEATDTYCCSHAALSRSAYQPQPRKAA